jgi:hypothetical protein
MPWQIRIPRRVGKSIAKLPERIQAAMQLLIEELGRDGPYRMNWPHYSRIQGTKNKFHCHVKSGRPTYVACWELTSEVERIIEVYYAGTHEKAPY